MIRLRLRIRRAVMAIEVAALLLASLMVNAAQALIAPRKARRS